MIKSRSYPSIGFVLSSLRLSDGWESLDPRNVSVLSQNELNCIGA